MVFFLLAVKSLAELLGPLRKERFSEPPLVWALTQVVFLTSSWMIYWLPTPWITQAWLYFSPAPPVIYFVLQSVFCKPGFPGR